MAYAVVANDCTRHNLHGIFNFRRKTQKRPLKGRAWMVSFECPVKPAYHGLLKAEAYAKKAVDAGEMC